MRFVSRTPTRKLATARLEFSGDRRIVTIMHLTAATALIILVIAIGRQMYTEMRGPDSLAGLQQQNAALRADLARVKTELELERSTRAALTDQVAQLNLEASQLKSRLDFFNAQSGRQGSAR
jgi:hypothetical protein